MSETINIYFAFLDRLNAAAVDYAVLHNWESLRLGEVSDIDMIVAARDLGRVEACFREHYRVLNVFHYEASSFGFVLAPKHDLSSVFIADISTDYRWRGRIFFTDRELLQNRQLWNGYWVAGPAQEFAYLFVKKIYEKGCFPEHQRQRIRDLLRVLEGEAATVLSNLLGPKWVHWALNRIRGEEWTLLEQHVPQLRRAMRMHVLKRDYLNSARYWVMEIQRFWERYRYPTGAAVAFVGPERTNNRVLKHRFTETFAGVFRQVSIDEPTRSRKVKHIIRDRGLLCRSALLFRNYTPDELRPSETTNKKLLGLPSSLMPSLDIVFIIDSDPSRSMHFDKIPNDSQPSYDSRPPVSGSECRPKVSVLDGQARPEDIARSACDIFGTFLAERYLQRRQIWF